MSVSNLHFSSIFHVRVYQGIFILLLMKKPFGEVKTRTAELSQVRSQLDVAAIFVLFGLAGPWHKTFILFKHICNSNVSNILNGGLTIAWAQTKPNERFLNSYTASDSTSLRWNCRDMKTTFLYLVYTVFKAKGGAKNVYVYMLIITDTSHKNELLS